MDLVGAAPQHPGSGGQAGDEALGALGQGGLLEGLAEGLGGHTRSGGLGLGAAAQHLFSRHGLGVIRAKQDETRQDKTRQSKRNKY
jgi:hypothetical protein